MILVTGGAGFIGSNVVCALNEAGRHDIVVCDLLRSGLKWQNLRKRVVQEWVAPDQLDAWLREPGRQLDAVVHLGANAATTAVDGDDILTRNVRFSTRLLDWCAAAGVPLVYASSAATYGDGRQGFADDWRLSHLQRLRPLNLYGWSKHQFDQVVAWRHEQGLALPPVCAGLKLFNVFGPNEFHKGSMMSVPTRLHATAARGDDIELFRSHDARYRDGEQMRDFVYVKDVCDVILWLLRQPAVRGLFNVGSGEARTWNDLITALCRAVGREPRIRYVDMPPALREHYQYYTCADLGSLRRLGYAGAMTPLEAALDDYVSRHLSQGDPYR